MKERFSRIRAFAFDVDGVMTDGGIFADNDGSLFRTFDAKDAFGMRMAAMNGYILCAITGGRDISILKRLMICGFKEEDIYLGSRNGPHRWLFVSPDHVRFFCGLSRYSLCACSPILSSWRSVAI
jgi:3-deoxy-D-manno-octulosonate 8-phosphate phosphatase KdsC-like HAD superfamily phosphatase